ncbi:MAG: translation initiation factor IF-3 [bacterium]|nr:translation initiation factor IF-3 [bacterium]
MRVNRRIRAREVRVIGIDGEQIGVMPFDKALELAMEQELDLVEVAPDPNVPVCKIMDFGKYLFEQKKKERDRKKKQKVIHVKEIMMRPHIEEHDYQFKSKNAHKFLEGGDKVKITMSFRGREMAHTEFGRKALDRLAEDLKEISTIETAPRLEGKHIIMVLAPIKKKG